MGYINQVQKGQEVTDIQDIRMPNITNADVGKYLKVKDDLSLEFAEVQGGGPIIIDLTENEAEYSYDTIEISGITEEQFNIALTNPICYFKWYNPEGGDYSYYYMIKTRELYSQSGDIDCIGFGMVAYENAWSARMYPDGTCTIRLLLEG